MRFRARRDIYFTMIISIILLVLAVVILCPLYFQEGRTSGMIALTITFLILCEGFIVWLFLDIQYTFRHDHLCVKGGPFRSKIPYEAITKVAPTTNIFIGYRILSARHGLEIHYKTGMWGSVKISPEKQTHFIKRLQTHCPHLQIDITEMSQIK